MTNTPTRSTDFSLVAWPYGSHQSTGEGGLFAYAVWSLNEIFSSFSGPVLNSFPQLTDSDVLTGAQGAEAKFFTAEHEALSKLRRDTRLDEVELAEYRGATKTPVIVFLGATDASLFDEHFGEYFSVGPDDLTSQGATLIQALEAIYGPATFLTFLDT